MQGQELSTRRGYGDPHAYARGYGDPHAHARGYGIVKTIALWKAEVTVFPMKRDFDVVIERDAEGYLVGSVPALPGCHTQARSFDKLQERIREAIELCLEE